MATYTAPLSTLNAPHRSKDEQPVVDAHALVRVLSGRHILKGIDLSIRKGEFHALLGRSGSGKSTLLRAIAGLDHQARGTGTLHVPTNTSMVFQDSRLLPWRRVYDNIALGLKGQDIHTRIMGALHEVGLGDRAQAWPYQLSGGEQQRVSLARSLVRDPELLLADEPFGALDALTRTRMHALLRTLCARHQPAVLLVTHDVDEAILLADCVQVLEDGKIAQRIVIDMPHPRSLHHPRFLEYRTKLLAALGVNDGV